MILSSNDDEASSLAQRWPDGVALLVVDHYGRDAAFENKCRPWATSILVIDDLADRRHRADFLMDQTCGRKEPEPHPGATQYPHVRLDKCYYPAHQQRPS